MGVVDVDFMITDVSEEGENSKKKGQQCFYISLYFPLSVKSFTTKKNNLGRKWAVSNWKKKTNINNNQKTP